MHVKCRVMADRISDLPDSVICYILSFLPTKVAVSTSVLSKRWKPLWRSVPAFDFYCDCMYDDEIEGGVNYKFLYSMNVFLGSRDPLQSLRRFCLKTYYHMGRRICHPTNAIELVYDAVVHHKLEHLELSLPQSIGFPSVLLSCKTLVVLKLKCFMFKDFSSIDLPLLKTLHLFDVCFTEYKLFLDLFFGCPSLEDMEIDVHIKSYATATEAKLKKFPKLVRAVLNENLIPFAVPLEVVSDVQSLCINRMGMEVKIFNDTPQFPNLTRIEFSFSAVNTTWLDMFKVFEHCPKLQHLVVDQIKCVSQAKYMPNWRNPPCVPTCISSELKTCCIVNYGAYHVEFEFARYIMQNARMLKNMTMLTYTRSQQKMLKMRKKLSLFSSTCKLSVQYNDVG